MAAASRDWIGDTATGAMLSATRSFLSAAAKDESVREEAAASLSAQSPGAVAWISVTLGTLVEDGASAQVSGGAVLDALRSWLPFFPAISSDEEPPPIPTPDQSIRLAQFQFLCQSAVTHLARLPALRETLGHDVSLIGRLVELGGYSHGAWWVREALLKTSGTLVLLHPPREMGLRLNFTNVSHCFHLFSLLQTAVGLRIPGGRVPDEAIAWVARGKSTEPVSDDAWWHYGNATSPKADISASIWGEGLVREIPRVNGEQVILLWPPILQGRTWDAGFLGPHLDAMPADAAVAGVLTPEEAQAWLESLGIRRERKSWWRIG